MRRDGVSQNSLFLERHVCYALGMQLDQSKVSGAEELRAQFQELPAEAGASNGPQLCRSCFHMPAALWRHVEKP